MRFTKSISDVLEKKRIKSMFIKDMNRGIEIQIKKHLIHFVVKEHIKPVYNNFEKTRIRSKSTDN